MGLASFQNVNIGVHARGGRQNPYMFQKTQKHLNPQASLLKRKNNLTMDVKEDNSDNSYFVIVKENVAKHLAAGHVGFHINSERSFPSKIGIKKLTPYQPSQ